MTEMVRKQIYMPKRQQMQVKRAAKAQGMSEAEYIRRAIDERLAGGNRGLPPDEAAWDQAVTFMRSLIAQGPLPKRAHRWTRDELYDEREGRYARRTR